uniref:cDNA FLJ46326 fis, clone TESTI4043378 n=1 Tax=Homo sapiens TaxID=9606 RepID=Q6ZRI9_HUMAN|nr:unnamed protein product [Homo sapiens]
MMVKGSIQQENLTILNIYAPNTGAPRFIKQARKDLQRDTLSHSNSGRLQHPTDSIRSLRQKINKDIQDLNSALDQMDLIDLYRSLHPKTTEHTFFSLPHGTYSQIDHIIGHKTSSTYVKELKSYQTYSRFTAQ